jgi:succinate-semialdehyde dehydrogenase/glutarate-semialdehyde dehydrogenase
MPSYPDIELLIGARWQRAPGAPIINPADESEIGTVPHASRQQLAEAISAAEAGLRTWRATAPAERSAIVLRAAALIRARSEEIATGMTLDQGKPLAQSRLEVIRGCEMLEWDAAEGRRLYGRVIPAAPGMRHYTLRQPVGVVAAFSPWNFPMSSPARKIGGALAAGCSLILKPPEETPAAAVLMGRAFQDAGLPPGVLNIVFGRPAEISETLIAHPAVRMVAFTGSTAVGKRLAGLAAAAMKPALMELGGHAPVIVCADADPAATAEQALQWKLRNAGQVCVSPTRFLVHDSIAEAFTAAFVRHARAIRVGAGMDESSQLGPLANGRRLLAMQELVTDAVAHGARLLCGGSRQGNSGYFYPPTVLADVPLEARVMNDEPFGPVATINRFDTLDEAIATANSLSYGLSAYAFTDSARIAYRLSEELEVGTLSINHFVASVAETPFGGVKDSGYGREGAIEGVEGYTVVKSISQRIS